MLMYSEEKSGSCGAYNHDKALQTATAGPSQRALTAVACRAQVRLDITSEDHVHWLNDLEEDSMYRRWSRSLLDLLRPMFPGQLPRIGRNVYNAAFLVDPATAAAGK